MSKEYDFEIDSDYPPEEKALFAKAFGAELLDSRLRPEEKLLLLWMKFRFLNDKYNGNKGTRVKYQTLAEDLGVSRESITKWAARLENLGFLYTESDGIGLTSKKFLRTPSKIYGQERLENFISYMKKDRTIGDLNFIRSVGLNPSSDIAPDELRPAAGINHDNVASQGQCMMIDIIMHDNIDSHTHDNVASHPREHMLSPYKDTVDKDTNLNKDTNNKDTIASSVTMHSDVINSVSLNQREENHVLNHKIIETKKEIVRLRPNWMEIDKSSPKKIKDGGLEAMNNWIATVDGYYAKADSEAWTQEQKIRIGQLMISPGKTKLLLAMKDAIENWDHYNIKNNTSISCPNISDFLNNFIESKPIEANQMSIAIAGMQHNEVKNIKKKEPISQDKKLLSVDFKDLSKEWRRLFDEKFPGKSYSQWPIYGTKGKKWLSIFNSHINSFGVTNIKNGFMLFFNEWDKFVRTDWRAKKDPNKYIIPTIDMFLEYIDQYIARSGTSSGSGKGFVPDENGI